MIDEDELFAVFGRFIQGEDAIAKKRHWKLARIIEYIIQDAP